MSKMISGPFAFMFDKRNFKILMATMKQEDLKTLNQLLENGKIKPAINKTFPLSEAADAVKYFISGNKKGKISISIKNEE